jgi:hypothetical protein
VGREVEVRVFGCSPPPNKTPNTTNLACSAVYPPLFGCSVVYVCREENERIGKEVWEGARLCSYVPHNWKTTEQPNTETQLATSPRINLFGNPPNKHRTCSVGSPVNHLTKGVLWLDDAQVASLHVEKVVASQGEEPRVEVLVALLPALKGVAGSGEVQCPAVQEERP